MVKPGKAEQAAARGERLAAALRENLKRRKQQARQRTLDAPQQETPEADGGHAAGDPDFRRNPGTKSGGESGDADR
jgi:hypothetical protein